MTAYTFIPAAAPTTFVRGTSQVHGHDKHSLVSNGCRHSAHCPRRQRGRWTSELAVVVGATGGVGRLIISRLLSSIKPSSSSSSSSSEMTFDTGSSSTTTSTVNPHSNSNDVTLDITKVRALVRSTSRASESLPITDPNLSLFEFSSSSSSSSTSTLKDGLSGASLVIICLGTTAFPTRAWRNGNTPRNVDDKLVCDVVDSVDAGKIERISLASSIGSGRVNRFPFFVLNAFGVLDAKRRGEQHVKRAAREYKCGYSIVRVGRLLGEPQTNVGMWVKNEPHPDGRGVRMERGDCLSGDLSRTAAADAVVYGSVCVEVGKNLDVCAVHGKGSRPKREEWIEMLRGVEE